MEFKTDIGKPWRWKDEDGLTVTRACAWSPPGCHPTACGIKYYTDDEGHLVRVEGDENNPITHGTLCVRCLTLKDATYSLMRVLHPMKRDPKYRGQADKWERITWDEAFDIIESEYRRITDKYGKESVVCFAGTGRQGGTMMPFGCATFGTPNMVDGLSGSACYMPRLTVCSYILGASYPEIDYAGALPGRYDDPSYEIPGCIICWGKDPLPSNPDGLWGHSIIELMKRGTKIITIDPRSTWLSTRAEYALRLRPGTDAALGMAMINIMVEEDLYDHDFVDKWCYGFEQLAERCQTMSPERAAKICGLDVEDIYGATRLYATSKPSSIAWGLAIDQKENGSQAGQVICALMAITECLDAPGGTIIGGANDALNEVGFGYDTMPQETQEKLIGLKEYPVYTGLTLFDNNAMTLDALETGKPYPLKMGFYMGNNIIACNGAQPKRWHDAIVKSLEFCIGFDLWFTPSVQATCDIMLPLATMAEQDGAVFTHYSALPVIYGSLTKSVECGEGKSDAELAYELGKRLNPQAWERFPTFMDFLNTLRFRNEYTHDYIKEKVFEQRPQSYYKYKTGKLRTDGQPGFNTPTGRVELWATMYQRYEEDPLPYYGEPRMSPLSTPDQFKKYPLVLTTGGRHYEYFHSEGRQIPYLREIHPDPTISINPKDAAKRKIHTGDWVVIENMFGKCQMRADVSPIVRPGVVHSDHGWWFPEEEGSEPHLYGVWRSNINNLMPVHGYNGSFGFGAPYKCLICEVTKGEVDYDGSF